MQIVIGIVMLTAALVLIISGLPKGAAPKGGPTKPPEPKSGDYRIIERGGSYFLQRWPYRIDWGYVFGRAMTLEEAKRLKENITAPIEDKVIE